MRLLLPLFIAFFTVASGFTVQPIATRTTVLQLHPDQGVELKQYAATDHEKDKATKAQIQKPNILAWCQKVLDSKRNKDEESPQPTK